MLNSNILEFALSLIFIYLWISVVTSAVAEWFSTIFKLRSKNLEDGIRQLLDRGAPVPGVTIINRHDFGELVKCHPIIRTLNDRNAMSYVPSQSFALAMIDVVLKDKSEPPSFEQFRKEVDLMQNDDIKKSLQSILNVTEPKLDRVRESIAGWFDQAMEHVSANYKKKMQGILFGVALALCILLNVDSMTLMQKLWTDGDLRRAVAASASSTAGSNQPSQEAIQSQINRLKLPIGWEGVELTKKKASAGAGADEKEFDTIKVLSMALGWLITAIAASLGAPFWFDLLNKVVNLRTGGKPPAPSTPTPPTPTT